MSKIQLVSLVMLIGIVSGCATAPSKPPVPPSKASRLISQDLVNVLFQVNSLHPQRVTLLLPEAKQAQEPFEESLKQSLRQVGYALRTAGGDASTVSVSYSVNRSVDVSSGEVSTYTVNMGPVSVRRAYQPTDDGWVTPMSGMQIRGTDGSRLILDDSIFQRVPDQVVEAEPNPDSPTDIGPIEHTPVIPNDITPPAAVADEPVKQRAPQSIPLVETPLVETPQEAPEELAENPPKDLRHLGLKLPQPEQQLAPQDLTQPAQAGQRARQALRQNQARGLTEPKLENPNQKELSKRVAELQNGPKQNMRDLGGFSNFAEILDSMSTVNEAVLVFADDSTRLGSINKDRVNQLVSQYNPELDVFSVTGCSHGPSSYTGGQEALALGRADRVKEALMFAGVPQSKILDEACWAEEQFDNRMPRRGVVLSIKRSING